MRSLLLALFVLSFAACSDPDGGTGAATVTISGTIFDPVFAEPIDGVEICFEEPAGIPCAITDLDGAASIEVPANSRVKVRLRKEGYATMLTHGNTEGEDLTGLRLALLSDEAAAFALQSIGVTHDETKGHMIFFAATDVTLVERVSAVTVESSATTGELIYFDDSARPDPEATETSSNGGGAMLNIDPGTYTLTYAHGSKGCVDGYAWPSASQPDNGVSVELPIEAGVLTFTSTYCN